MMHLGLNSPGGIPAEDWPLVQDLGVTWVKLSIDFDRDPERLLRDAEDCRAHGCQVVVDLRMDPQGIQDLYKPIHDRIQQGMKTPGSGPPALIQPGLKQYKPLQKLVRAAWTETMGHLRDWAAGLGEASRGLITDWEVQGEWTHPTVSRGLIGSLDFSLQLMTCAEGLRGAAPETRMWTGGNGIWLTWQWLRELVNPNDEEAAWWAPGCGEFFEVVNWHHYGASIRLTQTVSFGIEELLSAYASSFAHARWSLKRQGLKKWFASTEWGVPVREANDPQPLKASVHYQGGIHTVPESMIGEWYRACLDSFARHGFRVLCIHHLHDQDGYVRAMQHWGAFCGLVNYEGRKRGSFAVAQEYAWKARNSGKGAFDE